MTSVLTRSFDNARSKCNPREIVLTPDAVAQRGIRRAFSLSIPDDPRIDAQPVLLDGVKMPDGSTRNVIVVCSNGGRVYCFDSATGEALWMQKVATAIKSTPQIDAYMINVNWGILSTPVIDAGARVLYLCAWSSPTRAPDKARFWFHGISLHDGSSVGSIDLSAATYAAVSLSSAARKQRCGLLLNEVDGKKLVHVAFGSISESLNSARGWIITIDLASFSIASTWASTSRYSGAGIWQGGEGPASDAEGAVYVITGNGAFDGITDFGESFVKLVYRLPGPQLVPVDWFSPFSDAGRVGEPQDQPQMSKPYPIDTPSNTNDWTDQDLGSAGPLYVAPYNMLLGAGKDGILYVIDADNMGKTRNADFLNPRVNYDKLAVKPIWFTFFPGWEENPAPAKFMDLNVNYFNVTHHLHGSPAHYSSAKYGEMLYCMGENAELRAWCMNATGELKFLASGDESASWHAPVPPGGMPGGMLTVSSNGKAGPIVWALVPTGDANKQITQGVLFAYDGERFDTRPDGSQRLHVLWRSDQWGLLFSHPKFNLPVVANGRVYVPTYSGRVDVYELA
jgi:outer membrane protein assembly factor BamB